MRSASPSAREPASPTSHLVVGGRLEGGEREEGSRATTVRRSTPAKGVDGGSAGDHFARADKEDAFAELRGTV